MKEGDRALIVFAINKLSCREGTLYEGAVDANEDGVIDLYLTGVVGKLEICDELLEIFDVDCNEYSPSPFYDILAWFDGMATLSETNALGTETPVNSASLDDIKIRIELVKEMINEDMNK